METATVTHKKAVSLEREMHIFSIQLIRGQPCHHLSIHSCCLFSIQSKFKRNPARRRKKKPIPFENCIGDAMLHQHNSGPILLKSIERRIHYTTIMLRTVSHHRFYYRRHRRRRRENKIVIFFVAALTISIVHRAMPASAEATA